jgi:putative multiple sugar transport system permease protein
MKTIKTLFKDNIREYSMLIMLVVIMVFFQFVTDGTLFRPVNLTNLILQNSYIIIMAIGMLMIILTGWIDLSVGSVVAFVGALAAVLMVNLDVNWIVTVLICLLIGALIGAWQGFWVAYNNIPPFIVTLAGMLIFRGLTLATLNGQSIGPFPVEFQRISSGFIPDIFHGSELHITTMVIGVILSALLVYMDVRSRKNQQKYGFEVVPYPFFVVKNVLITLVLLGFCYLMASYKGLPNVLVILFMEAVIYTFITSQMKIGRRIYAMGGNEKAAELSGVNTKRLLFMTFVNMGFLAALAGLVFTARLNSATPKAGDGFELDVHYRFGH